MADTGNKGATCMLVYYKWFIGLINSLKLPTASFLSPFAPRTNTATVQTFPTSHYVMQLRRKTSINPFMVPWPVCLAMVLAPGQKHIVPHPGIETALLLLFANPNPHHFFSPMSRRKYESPSFCPQHLPCAAQERAPSPWGCLPIQLAPASRCFLLYTEREE